MNNDYLWEKKGSDAEIEGLEDLLSGFKYQPVEPPMLSPVLVLNEPARMPWWKFSLAFAVPACLLVAITVGFLVTRLGNEPSATIISSGPRSPEVVGQEMPALKEPDVSKIDEKRIEKIEVPSNVKTVFIPRSKTETQRPTRAKYRQIKRSKIETLTAEERFAYDQLKLALSITGSKLKVVSDTVNRTED